MILPETLTSIGFGCFAYCSSLTDIVLPSNVSSVSEWALGGCTSLKTINIPENLTTLSRAVFYNSGLEEITIPATVRQMVEGCLSTSTLKKVTIYVRDITGISYTESCFGNVNNTDLYVPEGSKYIYQEYYPWREFKSIVEFDDGHVGEPINPLEMMITVDGLRYKITDDGFAQVGQQDNSTLSGDIIIPEKISFGGNDYIVNSIVYPSNTATYGGHTSISAEGGAFTITSLSSCAFSGCSSLSTLTIPNSVTTIGERAFSRCSSLTSVVIPNKIETINEYTFSECYNLTSLSLPESVTTIKGHAFDGCSKLESLIIPSKVEYIYQQAFANCGNLQSVKSLAETPPFLYDNSFSNYEIPLYVPEGAREAYQGKEPWNKFKEILSGADTKYTLTYKVDGEVYTMYKLLEGAAITPEPAPTKEGYEFSGWSTIPATMPAEDVTITGTFTLLTDEDEITIKEIGKTTWCSKYDLDFTNVAGIKAYTATGYDDISKTIWLTRVMEVPAGTGFLVKGDPGTYKIPHSEVQSAYANWFVGNLGDAIKIVETDGDKVNYYLSGDGTFKSVNKTANIGTNKCYLQLPRTFEAAVTGATQTVKVGSIGKASFAAPVDLDFTNVSGLKAFTATGYDKSTKTIWLTRVMKVQKGEGVLLKGDPDNYEIPSVAVQSSYENMFVGNTSGDEIQVQETSEDGSQTNYYLSGKDGSFVSVNGFAKIGNNKCYLALPTSMVAVSSTRSAEDDYKFEEPEVIKLPIEFKSIGSEGDGTTGVKEVKSGEAKGDEWYTLQGQRVAKPGKGLYIRNGKKVVIK